jgi:hypothetical protein
MTKKNKERCLCPVTHKEIASVTKIKVFGLKSAWLQFSSNQFHAAGIVRRDGLAGNQGGGECNGVMHE